MLRNFKQEVEEVRQELCLVMQHTLPSKQFGTTIMLALVHLSLIQKQIKHTKTLHERREHINEFSRIRSAIDKGLKLLGNGTGNVGRGRGDLQELRKHLSCRVA